MTSKVKVAYCGCSYANYIIYVCCHQNIHSVCHCQKTTVLASVNMDNACDYKTTNVIDLLKED